ncbi:NTP transferase domain-containing protein [bacterium]|nr:NTP transferase domain-containing protein [bacterium]
MDMVVVIMAGGVGSRFWPLSTEDTPKQFLKLFGERSMLQKSFERAADIVPPERILVLTRRDFVPLVREQLPAVPAANIIGEPVRRDTAAAVALSAVLCRKRFGNPVIVTLTADHLIEPADLFRTTLLSAVMMADKGDVLYTFGIQPTYPATGYGYLERGALTATVDGIEHFEVRNFKEKPDLETARMYLDSGRFFWNSGMFVWKTDAIMARLEQFLPDHLRLMGKALEAGTGEGMEYTLEKAFDPLPSISIDFGVMEKARNVRCVKSTFSWIDVGGWLSLRDFLDKDEHGNFHKGTLVVSDSCNNLVFCEDAGETVMLAGIHDLVIVRSRNGTLVMRKDCTEDIKKLVIGKLSR